MYDTLSLWLPFSKNDFSTISSELPLKLNNFKETYNHTTTSTSISGSLNTMCFNIRKTGLFITGSLCKYHFGNNQQTLSIKDTQAAVESLSDVTGLPIHDASVYRIDFAENYILSQPEYLYYNFLGDSTYYHRLEQNNGLYYRNLRKQLVFYGKNHEQKLKKEKLLPIFEGKNVLRYEMRLNKKIPFQMGFSKVKSNMLYQPNFYIKMLEKYHLEYRSIYKKHTIMLDKNIIAEKNGLLNQILILGANEMGGEDELLKMIDSAKKEIHFSNAMKLKRMKDKIKSIFRTPILTKPSDLINELNEEISKRIEAEIINYI